jgi:hypothetical protein
MLGNFGASTGRSAAWQRTCLGSRWSAVQIGSPRPIGTQEVALSTLCRAVILGAIIAASSAAARGLPLQIELDGCVQPTPECESRDVVTLNEGNRKLAFAVETLRLLSSTRATGGGVLTEMKVRPLRVHGPDEVVHRLAPGTRLRVRAALRLHERYLLVQSVEPGASKP